MVLWEEWTKFGSKNVRRVSAWNNNNKKKKKKKKGRSPYMYMLDLLEESSFVWSGLWCNDEDVSLSLLREETLNILEGCSSPWCLVTHFAPVCKTELAVCKPYWRKPPPEAMQPPSDWSLPILWWLNIWPESGLVRFQNRIVPGQQVPCSWRDKWQSGLTYLLQYVIVIGVKSIKFQLNSCLTLMHIRCGKGFTQPHNSPWSQGRQPLIVFWWTKYVQSSSISVYSERIHAR